MSLVEDLMRGENESRGDLPCRLCVFINEQEDELTKSVLTAAAAGTMGERKFGAILTKHGAGIGRRTIARHRQEEHTP